MASDREFVEYVAGQLGALEEVSYRNMFGEYVLYYRGKVVVLICDSGIWRTRWMPRSASIAGSE